MTYKALLIYWMHKKKNPVLLNIATYLIKY